jgi:hypothetical protein
MTEINSGVSIIIERMEQHPEEFFGEGGKWKWMFKETLREVLTESEKAALYEGLKKVRRVEFSSMAASTVLRISEEAQEEAEKAKKWEKSGRSERFEKTFGEALAKREGGKVSYDR